MLYTMLKYPKILVIPSLITPTFTAEQLLTAILFGLFLNLYNFTLK